MSDTLACPNCGFEIEVSAALTAQVRDHMRKEMDAQMQHSQAELLKREEGLRQREMELNAASQSLDQEVLARLDQERTRLLQDAKSEALESVALEMHYLREQLTGAKDKLEQAQRAELQVRKERRELEDQKQEWELTVARQLDEERNKIREAAMQDAAEEYRLKEADKEQLVADLRRQILVLKRRSEQGSQQAQGEVAEIELEDLLRQRFPYDAIEAVPKGIHGGDVLQHVHDAGGQRCGTILWECKRTKSWNDYWLEKLRDDQRTAKAHLAALLTTEMPKDLSTFGCLDGIWVTSRSCVVGVAAALRAGLVEAARVRRSVEGIQSKVELVYQYVTGPEFRQRVEGIVDAFLAMQEDLAFEKRSFRRLWAKREKQIDRVVVNTASLYGDLSGIFGASLPQIANLELKSLTGPAVEEQPAANGVSEDNPF